MNVLNKLDKELKGKIIYYALEKCNQFYTFHEISKEDVINLY